MYNLFKAWLNDVDVGNKKIVITMLSHSENESNLTDPLDDRVDSVTSRLAHKASCIIQCLFELCPYKLHIPCSCPRETSQLVFKNRCDTQDDYSLHEPHSVVNENAPSTVFITFVKKVRSCNSNNQYITL